MSDNNALLARKIEQETMNGNEQKHDGSASPGRSDLISASDLREILHDLNGPLASARGFTEELIDVRRCMKELVAKPDIGTDKELMASLQDQIEEEMEYCLERVERSLVKLDSIIDAVRTRHNESD
ncbi:hypothetical protein N9383_05970 [Granulosicoccus sp.]|nr:hypothetical protein [Granulosicoccus sp.]